jgi:hypothetical protein
MYRVSLAHIYTEQTLTSFVKLFYHYCLTTPFETTAHDAIRSLLIFVLFAYTNRSEFVLRAPPAVAIYPSVLKKLLV